MEKENGWTPLHVAAARGHESVAWLLLDQRADAAPKTTAGQTPLHLAAANGNLAVAELLLENDGGADAAAAADDEGWYPLHIAAKYGHEAVVALLLDRYSGNVGHVNMANQKKRPDTTALGSRKRTK